LFDPDCCIRFTFRPQQTYTFTAKSNAGMFCKKSADYNRARKQNQTGGLAG
jgi:hypothetical protein